MRIYGSAALSDLLGEFVVYRSLRPSDPRLPSLASLHAGPLPRKGEPAYARVVASMLQAARRLQSPKGAIRRFLLVGDTQRSDGGAFETIAGATGWPGRAFICDEQAGASPRIRHEGAIDYANAWQALHAFQAALEAEEFLIDAETVVVLDIDKTLIGAKGRNHRLIDQARLRALRTSVADALSGSFDEVAFESIYRELDQARYHPLTEDNQDNVAYLCVMVVGGVLKPQEPARLVEEGLHFRDALDLIGARVLAMAPGLAPFHDEIARLVVKGDPTPFKRFRRREYLETCALMGTIEGASAEELLEHAIVITGEIWDVASQWKQRGALLFGLSDKPDEAAVGATPDEPPIHRIVTPIVGV